ncbi:MAG: family 16 glycoside hydrolase [Bacteroidia bacterium]|nr:family 16 glycoside hydrolase [Bacteroidia bacterium]
MKPLLLSRITLLALLAAFACTGPEENHAVVLADQPDKLEILPLNDLSGFQPTETNWKIAGEVFSLPDELQNLTAEPGTGILVNQNDDTHRKNIFTTFEHEDIEIEWEFMMPKGSNSGVYFQGRYEIQLFDSWKKDSLTHADCGGIYERWDETKPEGEQGFEGKAPNQNASLAPGLWQHLRVIFRAPRFDENGQKTENARFIEVIFNGIVIHEDVEVSGPTRAAAYANEQATGPLMIQGDHGPVAFRNIRYRLFNREGLAMDKINYRYYHGRWEVLPPFDSLEIRAEGTTRFFDIGKIKTRDNNYGVRFFGPLPIAKEGEYAFTIVSDDGSRLYIDNQVIVSNDSFHAERPRTGKVFLSEGEHNLTLDFFQGGGGEFLQVFVEGPGTPYSPFHSPPSLLKQGGSSSTLVWSAREYPELLRSFSMFAGEKRTHVINVGDPKGLNYAYDLQQGSLLKLWRGGFVNVAPMWEGRGNDQLALPLGTAVEICGTPTLARIENPSGLWPDSLPPQAGFYPRGYELDEAGYPIFTYSAWETLVKDHIIPRPETGRIDRELICTAPTPRQMLWVVLARGATIRKIADHYYNIGGKYYLHTDPSLQNDLTIRKMNSAEELVVPVLRGEKETHINYSIEW